MGDLETPSTALLDVQHIEQREQLTIFEQLLGAGPI